jgi:hypothetical protein
VFIDVFLMHVTVLPRMLHGIVCTLFCLYFHLPFMLIVHMENKTEVLWDVTPCSLIPSYECSRGTYCLYLEGIGISHVGKQGTGTGKKEEVQGWELNSHT